jgi:hypothetical protein
MKTAARTLLAGISALLAPCANAVNLASDGLGQALIFPYYTVQADASGNTFDTFISVVNTRAEAKVARMRFREGRNGREVAAFNLYLAPNDVWTGAVIPMTASASSPAVLISVDVSCTNPHISLGDVMEFTTSSFTGGNADGLGDDAARTREGYVELIEMATLTGASAASATHGIPGAPSCAGLTGVSVPLSTAAPSGGLMGTLTVINVASGGEFTANAVALAQVATRSFYRNYNDPYPDFNAAEVDPVSVVVSGGKTYRMQWSSGLDAVQSVLMHRTVESELTLDTGTNSATDWIVTFPTKRFYDPANPRPPFQDVYRGPGAQMKFVLDLHPRNSAPATLSESCDFTCPGGWYQGFDLRLPWATSVVAFKPRSAALEIGAATVSGALGSRNAWLVPLPTGSQSGRASLAPERFGALGSLAPLSASTLRHSDGAVAVETVRINGFPMVGFEVHTFINGLLTCSTGTCQGNYGGSFPHKWTTSIQP